MSTVVFFLESTCFLCACWWSALTDTDDSPVQPAQFLEVERQQESATDGLIRYLSAGVRESREPRCGASERAQTSHICCEC